MARGYFPMYDSPRTTCTSDTHAMHA
jgi:hypothetical protein